MKKILLATTMLIGTAGFAAAEVTISGNARMGVVSGFDDAETGDVDESVAKFSSRARVSFSLSGETDGGLAFGASFGAHNADPASKGLAGSVFVSMNGAKLSMGDLDSAAQATVGQVDGVGFTGNQDLNEIVYLGNQADPSVMVEYAAGGLSIAVSTDNNTGTIVGGKVVENDVSSLAASYTMDAYTFSLGYETADAAKLFGFNVTDVEHLVLGANAAFGNVTVKARYSSADGTVLGSAVDAEQLALSATYSQDALSVTGFMRSQTAKAGGVTEGDLDSVGLGASYDLGGGAAISGGVARLKDKLANESDSVYDLGLTFSF